MSQDIDVDGLCIFVCKSTLFCTVQLCILKMIQRNGRQTVICYIFQNWILIWSTSIALAIIPHSLCVLPLLSDFFLCAPFRLSYFQCLFKGGNFTLSVHLMCARLKNIYVVYDWRFVLIERRKLHQNAVWLKQRG